MLISIPSGVNIISTNVVEPLPIYDPSETYEDGDLAQYDPSGGSDYSLYGILNDSTLPSPHHKIYYYSAIAPDAITDGKNYSLARAMNIMEYEISSENVFDTIALGGLVGDSITVQFLDPYQNEVYLIDNRTIDNRVDDAGRHEPLPVTEVLYCPVDLQHGSSVKITIESTDEILLGTVLLGLSVNAGFTNLSFKNSFKDYSPTETDQWGNVVYLNGLKVNIHSGKVDIPIHTYDYMNRIMLAIGGRDVILNGYGSKHNDKPDASKGHFYATIMIGRVTKFALATNLVDKRLGELATYTFEIQEIV